MKGRDAEKYKEILARCNHDEELATDIFIGWKCKTDLYFLATEILGLSKAREKNRNRLDPVFHGWLAGKLQPNVDRLILVPRGHMKSTFMKIKVVQLILQNPMIRIGLFSRTASLVEEQLADIKRLLSTPLLRRYFPDLLPEPGLNYKNWDRSTLNQLTVRRSPDWGRIPQEEQIEAWGMGATITGRHYDVIMLDDILNEQSVSTLEQIMKVRDYYSYLQAIKEPDGFEQIVGTRYHYADLYGTIIKEGWFKRHVYTRQAIENGKPIYKFFTLKNLEKIKSRTSAYIWSCQYENNPIPKELQVFPPPYPMFTNLPEGKYAYYITVDPAATTKTHSDYTGFVVTGISDSGKMYVVEAIQVKKKGDEIADILIGLVAKYKPTRIGIEFGLQTALSFIIQAKQKDYEARTDTILPMPIHPIKIPRNMSKETRIERSLGSFIRDDRIIMHVNTSDLQRQMEHFPRAEHDDLIDALSMQFQLIERFRSPYWDEVMYESGRHGRSFFDLFGRPWDDQGTNWETRFVS